MEDLLKPGHLTRLLEDELAAEVEALCVGDVSGGLERLLSRLRMHRDSCPPPQLQVPGAAAHCTFRILELFVFQPHCDCGLTQRPFYLNEF